ncbi:MAG: DNA adenine methylase, partial [Thermoprotei archaeon]
MNFLWINMELHRVIKFWARKPTNLIVKELPQRTNVIADPFCGSGTTGFAGLYENVDQIFLSDINPVSVFVTSTLLSKVTVSEEVLSNFQTLCQDIENEVYIIGNSRVSYAVWVTIFICPRCGGKFRVRRVSNRVKCVKCGINLPPKFFSLDEELLCIFV